MVIARLLVEQSLVVVGSVLVLLLTAFTPAARGSQHHHHLSHQHGSIFVAGVHPQQSSEIFLTCVQLVPLQVYSRQCQDAALMRIITLDGLVVVTHGVVHISLSLLVVLPQDVVQLCTLLSGLANGFLIFIELLHLCEECVLQIARHSQTLCRPRHCTLGRAALYICLGICILAMHLGKLHERLDLELLRLDALVHNCPKRIFKLSDGILPSLKPHEEFGKVLPELQLLWVAPQCFAVIGNSPLIVMRLHRGPANFLHHTRIHLALFQVQGLLEGLDGVVRLLDGQQGIAERQEVLDCWAMVHHRLEALRVSLLVSLVLEVDLRHCCPGTGKLGMVRLAALQHIQGVINLTVLNGKLAVCNEHSHLL
mmetsp:Transcript_70268/g.168366  ORF Transcript_70268/g.168366 Transcript_70268/m.168366 type:complete len:367 (+) Transcript_70268:1077-2177(+)